MFRYMSYCQFTVYRKTLKSFIKYFRRSSSGVSPLSCNHSDVSRLVLGIETSCDDTGAAVVDNKGNVLGDALISQVKVHTDYGGIVLPRAQALHSENIGPVVEKTLTKANVTLQDLDAIAVTVKPGLALSLEIGLSYAKELVRKSGKPLIPIHHMEAHALTARMLQRIDFPYLVFLLSGGHCLLAVAKDIDDFILLGTAIDLSPGVFLDRTARELGLKNLPQCEGLSGGASVELLAIDGDPLSFPVPHLMLWKRDCDFSFSGPITYFKNLIAAEKEKQGLSEDQILPNAADICAASQYCIARNFCRKLHRAFLYCELKELLPPKKTLVVSGGVASNLYFREKLKIICDMFSCEMVCPPQNLCTDNGIMIAWNGMEKLLAGREVEVDPMSLKYEPKVPFGVDMREDLSKYNIKLPRFKLE